MSETTETKPTITVDKGDLRQLLSALAGQPHQIMELIMTRGLGDNPIDNLIEQFNAQVES